MLERRTPLPRRLSTNRKQHLIRLDWWQTLPPGGLRSRVVDRALEQARRCSCVPVPPVGRDRQRRTRPTRSSPPTNSTRSPRQPSPPFPRPWPTSEDTNRLVEQYRREAGTARTQQMVFADQVEFLPRAWAWPTMTTSASRPAPANRRRDHDAFRRGVVVARRRGEKAGRLPDFQLCGDRKPLRHPLLRRRFRPGCHAGCPLCLGAVFPWN